MPRRQRNADELRQLALALEDERARLEEAQRVAKVGSWETDLASLKVTWSDETFRIFGLDPSGVGPTHETFLRHVHPEDQEAVDAAFRASFASRDIHTVTHRIVLDDGTVKHVEERWRTVVDDAGAPLRAVGTCQDITERRRLEAQLLRAQRMESIGTLAGGIAHDLNNVLAPIIGSIEMLRADLTRPDQLELLDAIEASARRGADLVRQVLTFARGTEGERVAVDVRRIVRDIERIVHETFPKDIVLVVRGDREPWWVSGDATQINQVLMNLCVNARDAMPHGGTLTIELRNLASEGSRAEGDPQARVGDHLLLAVSDTGHGIPPAIQDRLFEPFFTTKPVGHGTGLGLSTVHSIVRSHRGFITVQSEPGRGSRFEVHLPRLDASATATPVASPDDGLPRGRGELVLVVDDEDAIRLVVKRTLERHGYRVLCAADGAAALALHAQHAAEVALVVTDMAMPVMDGPTMVVALRARAPTPPIIASSGLTTPDTLHRSLGDQVARFLAKPYSAEELLVAVRDAIAGR